MTSVLTDNLPLLAGAPNGIKKLRELILELAVRGKLVPQDASDEPASEFLKRVALEKSRLEEGGLVRKQKSTAVIREEEKPFELPHGWVWIRLADVAFSQAGFAFKSNGFNQAGLGLPLIRIRDVGQAFSGTFYEGEYRLEFAVQNGDYLISMDGEFRVCPWMGEKSLLNQRVSRLIFFGSETAKRFIAEALQARLRELQGIKAYTTVDHLSGGQISDSVIGLPPLEEQRRIVAKVDELMALCDTLEAQQADAESAHARLVQALLDNLTQARDAQDFAAHWQRLSTHFDTLFTTESSIDALKQTLLQLAVMGKLVPQDPSDESASALLKRISAQKSRLIAEGEIRKSKPVVAVAIEDAPFEQPQGWSWVRLEEISIVITKGSSPKWQGVLYTENPNDVLFVTSENVGSYRLRLDSKKYVERKFNDIEPRSILKRGDFLMNIVGASIGRTAIFDLEVDANINQAVCLIRISEELSESEFLLYFFNSEVCVSYMFDKQVDNARANLSMGNIANFVVPLPPIAEQHRIVAKVDQLMTLCDQLKTRLRQARDLNQQLATTLVEQAVV